MMNNFTPRAQQVLALARREAERLNKHCVTADHLLLGIKRLGQGMAFNVLQKLGVDLEKVTAEIEARSSPETGPAAIGNIPYTPDLKAVLVLAGKESKTLNHSYVGTEHILLGILREGQTVAAQVLQSAGLDVERTRVEVVRELNPNAPLPVLTAPGASTTPAGFRDIVSDAIGFWERRRIVYNVALGLIVFGYFIRGLPGSWKGVSLDGVLGLFLLAVGANILFCAAYLPDLFLQISVYRAAWRRGRWIVFAIGLASACILTRWFSVNAFEQNHY